METRDKQCFISFLR